MNYAHATTRQKHSLIASYAMSAGTEKGEKTMYILVNHENGEIKKFTDYNEMKKWWFTLTKEETFEWSGYCYISKDSELSSYF